MVGALVLGRGGPGRPGSKRAWTGFVGALAGVRAPAGVAAATAGRATVGTPSGPARRCGRTGWRGREDLGREVAAGVPAKGAAGRDRQRHVGVARRALTAGTGRAAASAGEGGGRGHVADMGRLRRHRCRGDRDGGDGFDGEDEREGGGDPRGGPGWRAPCPEHRRGPATIDGPVVTRTREEGRVPVEWWWSVRSGIPGAAGGAVDRGAGPVRGRPCAAAAVGVSRRCRRRAQVPAARLEFRGPRALAGDDVRRLLDLLEGVRVGHERGRARTRRGRGCAPTRRGSGRRTGTS